MMAAMSSGQWVVQPNGDPVQRRLLSDLKDHPKVHDRPEEKKKIQYAAAKLYGLGYKRGDVAKRLRKHLIDAYEREQRPDLQHRAAVRRLKAWEMEQGFRDLIWEMAIVKNDMRNEEVLEGVFQKARRGRVDAAKLLLELTGRYSPKGETAPTNVAIVFGSVPRPPVDIETVDGNAKAVEP